MVLERTPDLILPEEMYPIVPINNSMQRIEEVLNSHKKERKTSDRDALLPRMIGDGRRLKQVLMNLVRNALKFTQFGGKVTIRAGCFENLIVVNVEDTGAGIAKDDFPKLFTRFGKL